jgi:hypothetical protein
MIDDYDFPKAHSDRFQNQCSALIRAATDELEEVALAAAAAGIPASRMLIRMPHISNGINGEIKIESAIGFIPEGCERR